jgi:GGDEF domain-containing protein
MQRILDRAEHGWQQWAYRRRLPLGQLEAALAARIGVSIGTSTLGRHGTGLDELHSHADALLYRQKQARGRSRGVETLTA